MNESKTGSLDALLTAEYQKQLQLVSASATIPRFRIFYNSHYVKSVGLPTKHVLTKVTSQLCLTTLRFSIVTLSTISVLLQSKDKMEDFVTSQFLPALSLLSRGTAHGTAAAVQDLFRSIRHAYGECPMARLLQKCCSLSSVVQRAESLDKATTTGATEEGTAEYAVDVSGLFATPASKGSTHSNGAPSCSNSSGSKQACDAVQSPGQASSTWHSTASSDMKMTLTSSTDKVLTAHSNSMSVVASPAGAMDGQAPVQPAVIAAKNVPIKKKRKRGCRAGKHSKKAQGALPTDKRSAKFPKVGKGVHGPSRSSNPSAAIHRTQTQEIQASIDKLLQKHSERELITVGESIVNRALRNVRTDRRVQELGIGTQDVSHSLPSLHSMTPPTTLAQGPTQAQPQACAAPADAASASASEVNAALAGAPPIEDSETYASVVSAVNRHSQDRKRKFVSIQETTPSSHASSSPPSAGGVNGGRSGRMLDCEFPYFIHGGTLNTLPATGSASKGSIADTSPSMQQSGVKSSQLSSASRTPAHPVPIIPRCPDQLGDVVLQQCSRAKRKKLKFKFRALFKGALQKSTHPMDVCDVHRSPVLPDSVESGLLHHLSRPFLTEVCSADKGRNTRKVDPRCELFPSSADLPGKGAESKSEPVSKMTARLDRLVDECDLLSLSTPVSGVTDFVKAICRIVFPLQTVWGTRHNLNAFMSILDSYVKLGRQETFTLAEVIKGIHISDIPWLRCEDLSVDEAKLDGAAAQVEEEPMFAEHTQCSDSEDDVAPLDTQGNRATLGACKNKSRAASMAQMQLFLTFMNWLYAEFVNSLIAACFYATEVEGRGAEVLFYRKPLWARIVNKGKIQLFRNFVPVRLHHFPFALHVIACCNHMSVFIFVIFFQLVCSEEAHLMVPPGLTRAPSIGAVAPFTVPAAHSISRSSTSLALAQEPTGPVPPAAGMQRLSSLPPANGTALPPSTQSGSMLFNELLRANTYPVASLADENNNIITNLPISRTSTGVNKVNHSVRLKNFLLRLPVVRFVPKKSSVRAITNLRSKRSSNGTYAYNGGTFTTGNGQQIGEVLTNSALYNCLHVLKSVHASNPALAGFGAFGLDDIYLKLLKYKDNLAPPGEDSAQRRLGQKETSVESGSSSATAAMGPADGFFVAVLDLEKCYDNVDPTKLYDILKRTLIDKEVSIAPAVSATNEGRSVLSPARSGSASKTTAAAALSFENVIHKYAVTHPMKSMDRNISKNVRFVAGGAGEIVPFRAAAEGLAHCYPYSILTDAVVYPKITYQEVLRLLKIHLFQHAVKIAPSSAGPSASSSIAEGVHQYFTQVKGIPQGSVLSPLLCTLYYGNAEGRIFGSRDCIELIGLVDKTVVIRLMDDYIVISTEQQCVQHFLQLAHQSLKAYGAGVNPLKTKVNFSASVDVDGETIPLQRIEGEEMPWCGLLINTRTLEVTCHFVRILERPLLSSVLVEFTRSGAAFKRAIKTFMRTKCHAIVLDAQLNSKPTVACTLYTMYLVVAMRTHAYLKHLRQATGQQTNPAHIQSCITEGIMFGARLIYTRTARKSCRKLHLGSSASQYHGGVGNEEDEHLSPSAVDLRLFSECVESFEPDCFGSCVVTVHEVRALAWCYFIFCCDPILRLVEQYFSCAFVAG